MSSLSPQVVGPLLGIVAAVSLSVAALAIRRGSSTEDGSSFDALLVVLIVNVLILVPATLLLYRDDPGLTLRSIGAFAGAGLVGTGLGRMAYYKGIELVGASRAEPVKSSMPLYATLFAVLFLGESVSGLRWLGIAIIILGIGVISWELSGGESIEEFRDVSMTGVFLGVAAAMLFGLEPILAKIGLAEGTPSLVGLMVKTVAATVFFFAYATAKDQFEFARLRRGTEWVWYAIAGVANTTFLVGYYAGLEIAPVSVVTPLVQTSPLFVAVLSYLFLPDLEHVTRYVVAGVTLVVTGAALITVAT
jgi:drug/metabolite transporter (DMT)-like permease